MFRSQRKRIPLMPPPVIVYVGRKDLRAKIAGRNAGTDSQRTKHLKKERRDEGGEKMPC